MILTLAMFVMWLFQELVSSLIIEHATLAARGQFQREITLTDKQDITTDHSYVIGSIQVFGLYDLIIIN